MNFKDKDIIRLNERLERIDSRTDKMTERVTEAMAVINTDHQYIHEQIAYKAHLEVGTVAATAIEFAFKTPENKFPHFKNLKIMGLGGSAKASIMRGTAANPLVIDSPGDADPEELTGPVNLYDGADNPSGVVITKTPTYVTAQSGEVWDFAKILGDSTNQYTTAAETKGFPDEELDMKKDTYYVIKIERVGTESPEHVTLTMFWYEEESR